MPNPRQSSPVTDASRLGQEVTVFIAYEINLVFSFQVKPAAALGTGFFSGSVMSQIKLSMVAFLVNLKEIVAIT